MLKRLFSKANKVKYDIKKHYFTTIYETSIYQWYESANEGNLSILRRGLEGDEKRDVEAFELLFNQYVDKIGLSREYLDMLRKEQLLAKMKLDFIVSMNEDHERDRKIINDINIIQDELDSMKSGEQSDFYETLVQISKIEGRQIKPMETTIAEYEAIKRNLNKR